MEVSEQLFTVCVLATTADRPRAQALSLDWFKELRPSTTQTAEEMLPTPVSPSGSAPATHFLCCMTLTEADWQHMQAHKERNNSPVVVAFFGLQEDTLAARNANRDKWLAQNGLKVID